MHHITRIKVLNGVKLQYYYRQQLTIESELSVHSINAQEIEKYYIGYWLPSPHGGHTTYQCASGFPETPIISAPVKIVYY